MKLAIFGLLLTTKALSAPLFIGDSHSVMTFGATLAELLPGTQRFAVAGSAANDWLVPAICPKTEECGFNYGYATPAGSVLGSGKPPPSFPGLNRLLDDVNPSTVIVALGTNDATQRCHMPTEAAMKPVKELIQAMEHRRCVWIGPPVYKKGPVAQDCLGIFDSFVDKLKKTVEGEDCSYIDSRLILDDKTGQPIEADGGDQVHFNDRLARLWATSVAKKIADKLR